MGGIEGADGAPLSACELETSPAPPIIHPPAWTINHNTSSPTPMTLTPREAAFVSDSDVQLVQRAVDGGVGRKRTRTVRGRKTRVLGRPELRFFGALHGHEDTLTLAGRQKLYKAVQRPRGGKASLGVFVVDVEDVDRRIERRLAELNRIKSRVDDGGHGEPVVKGTAVPVHVVAALAEAGGVEAAMQAYPSLSKADTEAAVQYAVVYPKRGRPYPAKSLKRMLSELALPDEVFGTEPQGTGAREVAL